MTDQDKRLNAFCTPHGPEIFHSITHRHQIWKEDPYDVDSIQQTARDTFERYVNRACAQPTPDSGRILLIKGDSGSGKTHLMQAFRHWTHERNAGYYSYMQMTSTVTNYARYVLSNTLDALDKPHYHTYGQTSSLMRLANALVEDPRVIPNSALSTLREKTLAPKDLSTLIFKLADRIVQSPKFSNLDLDLIRVLLYLQPGNPSLKIRVLKYLRCEALAEYDCRMLGGIIPLTDDDQPMRRLSMLGQLMWAVDMSAFVICLDQLEDILDLHNEQTARQFRHAMQTIITLADQIPTAVIVISCLADFYVEFGPKLSSSHRARIESDPAPIVLQTELSETQIQHLISKRLLALYDDQDIPFDEAHPLAPFPSSIIPQLSGQKIRQILDWCRQTREQCIRTGTAPKFNASPEASTPEPKQMDADAVDTLRLARMWNDFHATHSAATPDSDAQMQEVLAWGILQCCTESSGVQFHVDAVKHGLQVDILDAQQDILESLLIHLCNAGAQGGGLRRQVDTLRVQALTAKRIPIMLRCTDFPKNPKSKIAQQIGQLIAEGGRRISIEDTDWRTLQTLRQFQTAHGTLAVFKAWLNDEKPLTQLPSLQAILNLNTFSHCNIVEVTQTVTPAPQATPPESAQLTLGYSRDFRPQPVTLSTHELCTHAAFLGGSGSGKTTLALHVIEQLAMQGIPCILVDRKGDLCRLADRKVWLRDDTPERMNSRKALYERLDIALYTPGSQAGRPLCIALVPPGIEQLPSAERMQMANYSAMALGEMMNYKPHARGVHKSQLAILGQAINILGDYTAKPTLQHLIDLIDSQDPGLMAAIGKLEIKLFKGLVSDLQTLKLLNPHLFTQQNETLNAETLFGVGPHKVEGKTRLSIISTSALGEHANILFWVAQLLIEIGRYGSRHPASSLQAVVLFDEADLYLPAQSKPATKEPMENLLKRARSAGIGLLLATQSPGDLDYKSRDQISTWFIGKVKEETALKKLKPMLSEATVDVTRKLATQTVGQFYMIKNSEVTSLQAERALTPTEQVPEEQIIHLAKHTRA